MHVAAADEVAPSCAYVPAAHKEPEQEDAPEVKKRVDVKRESEWYVHVARCSTHMYMCVYVCPCPHLGMPHIFPPGSPRMSQLLMK